MVIYERDKGEAVRRLTGSDLTPMPVAGEGGERAEGEGDRFCLLSG